MVIIKNISKNIVGTFLFFLIGWILLTISGVLFYYVGTKTWIYLIAQTIYMVLGGILFCYIINKNTLSSKLVSLKKNRKYYNSIIIQVITWIVIFTVFVTDDVNQNITNIILNFIVNLFNLSYDTGLFINTAIAPNLLTFLFITIMGATYTIIKYFFDER